MARPRRNQNLTQEVLFHGGAQILTDPAKNQNFQWRKLENVTLDEVGMASKRLGVQDQGATGLGGSTLKVLSFFEFKRPGTDGIILAHFDDGSLKYTSNTVSWTTITTGLSTSQAAAMSFTLFDGKVWMANGVNNFASWDGTTYTTYASVPKFKFVTAWKDGLWGAATSTEPHIVYSSDAGDGTSWPALNFVHINKGGGLGISGLTADAASLIIFKYDETHALYDPVEYTNRMVDSHKGCLHHLAIIHYDGKIYFASHLGICVYLGDAPSQIISQAIDPIFTNSVYSEGSYWGWSGYHFKQRIGFCWPRDSADDIWQMEYYPNLPEQPWTIQTMPVRHLVSQKDAFEEEQLYGFGKSSNLFYRCYWGTTSDQGVGFNGTLESGWFDFENPYVAKYISRVVIMARGLFTLYFLTDYDDTTIVKTHSVNAGSNLEEMTVYTDLYCRVFAVRIVGAGIGGTDRRLPVGSEVEVINEGEFAVGKMSVFGLALGVDR